MTIAMTKQTIVEYINVYKDEKGLVTVNQHEVANAFGLNSGHISRILKTMIEEGQLVKVAPHSSGRPAVYKVVA